MTREEFLKHVSALSKKIFEDLQASGDVIMNDSDLRFAVLMILRVVDNTSIFGPEASAGLESYKVFLEALTLEEVLKMNNTQKVAVLAPLLLKGVGMLKAGSYFATFVAIVKVIVFITATLAAAGFLNGKNETASEDNEVDGE
jgi:hypothetical protein